VAEFQEKFPGAVEIRTWVWGESFADGEIAEEDVPTVATDGADVLDDAGDGEKENAEENAEEEEAEKWKVMRYPGGSKNIRYRGTRFLYMFKDMLNETGGVHVHWMLKAPSADAEGTAGGKAAKGAASPEEIAEL